MIPDPHDRTRAILWMLQDVDPQMPIATALGYLRAVEHFLKQHEAELAAAAEKAEGPARYRGMQGPANLVRDFSSDPVIVGLARDGNMTGVANELHARTGADVAATVGAAQTMVSLFEDSGGMPPF